MERGSDSGSLPLEDNVLSSISCCFSKYCASVFLYPLVLRSPTPGHSRTRAHTVICGHCSNVLRPPVVCWDLLDGNCVMQMDAWKIISKCHWLPLVCTAFGQREKSFSVDFKGRKKPPFLYQELRTPASDFHHLYTFLRQLLQRNKLKRPSLNKLDLSGLPCICIEIKGRQYFCYKNNFLITAWYELLLAWLCMGQELLHWLCTLALGLGLLGWGSGPRGTPRVFTFPKKGALCALCIKYDNSLGPSPNKLVRFAFSNNDDVGDGCVYWALLCQTLG